METILAHAQNIVYTLLSLIPSEYQRENLEAMLGLFLEDQGHPLPQHSRFKSASALSRFLNIHMWSTRQVIRTTPGRTHINLYQLTMWYSGLNGLTEKKISHSKKAQ